MPEVKINLGRVKGSMWYTGTADSDAAIKTSLTSAGYVLVKLDMYMNVNNGNVYQYLPLDSQMKWVLKGNIKGVRGEGFQIKKTYNSVEAMNSGFATDEVPLYGFVLINTNNVEDEENARLYIKGENSYQFLTDLSGSQGIKGERGEKGEQGIQGIQGIQGEKGMQGHGFYRVTGSLTTSSTTVARNLILPNTGKLLVSDSLVDANGLVFAVTQEVSNQESTVNIAYRASIKGAKGEQGDKGDKGENGERGYPALMVSRTIELTGTPIANTSITIGADTSSTDTVLFNRTPQTGDNTYLIAWYQSTTYILAVTCTNHDGTGTTFLINSIVDISSNSGGGGGGTGGSVFYLDISAESSVTALQARKAVNAYNSNSVVLCRFAGILTATLVSVVGSAGSMTGNTVLTFLADLGGTIIKLTIDLPDTVSDSEEITVQQEEFGGGEKKRLVYQNDSGLGQSFPANSTMVTNGVEIPVSESIYNKRIEIWWSNSEGLNVSRHIKSQIKMPDDFGNIATSILERTLEVKGNSLLQETFVIGSKETGFMQSSPAFYAKLSNYTPTGTGFEDTTSESTTVNMYIYRVYIIEE